MMQAKISEMKLSARVAKQSAQNAAKRGTVRSNARCSKDGKRKARTILKHLTGFTQIQRTAQNVTLPLKRTVDVITSYAKARTANTNSAGSVSARGINMARRSITVIATLRKKTR